MTSSYLYSIVEPAVFWSVIIYTYWAEKRQAARSVRGSGELDRRSREAIRAGLLSGLALAWLCSAIPAIRWPSLHLCWLGIGLMIAGLWFRYHSIRTLGRAFSIYATIQEEQRLVQTGVYRYLRHPTYTGALIWFIGLGVHYRNPLSLIAIVALPLIIGYRYRIQVEEEVLLQAWGEAYRNYMRRTYRLIPFVW
jgi:protein-S-isoprenylcysteine O-methyltransferase Ste14